MAADISYWRSLVHKQLGLLLDASPSYTSEQAQTHLDRVDKCLIDAGALGPRPTSSVASWHSYLTDDHSPIEYSVSIKKNACTIRFAFEPLSPASGTPLDPVNHVAPTQWLSHNKAQHDNLSWFDTLTRQLTINSGDNAPLQPDACGLSQHVFGFDLVKTPMLKSYIFHDAVGRQLSASSAEWGRQKDLRLAQALDSIGLGTPWSKVASYLDQLRLTHPDRAGQAEFIGWDAVDPKVARMKVYVRFAKANLQQLISHLTLGGLLESKPHTREITTAATEMWHVLASQKGEADTMAADDLQGCENRTHGVILYYELKQNDPDPIPKFYFPVRHYFSSDLEIATRFDAFLAEKQIRPAGWYLSLLKQYCDYRDLGSRAGLQTMLGCAVRKGEWELSMYLSAEVYAPERFPSDKEAKSMYPVHAPAVTCAAPVIATTQTWSSWLAASAVYSFFSRAFAGLTTALSAGVRYFFWASPKSRSHPILPV